VVRKVDPSGTITTVVGTGEMGFNHEKGPAAEVTLSGPRGLFLEEDSDVLYIADIFNHRIRAVRLEEGT
jgi:serine/threonine protein kinase, bacterial